MAEVDRGPATDSACHDEAARVRSAGKHAAHEGASAAPKEARHPGSARRRATPSFDPTAAAGTVLRSHHSHASSLRAGTSGADKAGSAARGAEARVAQQQLGAAGPCRTPAAGTSSAHTWLDVPDSIREKHSWRGRPTPAHSPIRPPPSTRRERPAPAFADSVVCDASVCQYCSVELTAILLDHPGLQNL